MVIGDPMVLLDREPTRHRAARYQPVGEWRTLGQPSVWQHRFRSLRWSGSQQALAANSSIGRLVRHLTTSLLSARLFN